MKQLKRIRSCGVRRRQGKFVDADINKLVASRFAVERKQVGVLLVFERDFRNLYRAEQAHVVYVLD